MASNVLSRLAVVITANTAQMVGQLGAANNKLSLMSKSMATLKNTLLGTFGAYAVLHAIQNTVGAIAEFDREITAVKAITGTTGKDFDRLRESALQLGTSTQFAASKVAGLQLEFARLGFSNTEILQSTEATIDLATTTGEDLARSAEIAGSTLRAFQIDASDMTRVTDVMSKALNVSALTLDSFADGIKYVAPVAYATNVSLEETAALLSILSDSGIKGTQAGTSLRRIFTLLTKDGGTLQERLAELAKTGITLANANDEVGLYAQTALLQIVSMYPQVLKLTEGMYGAGGETKKLATVMKDNLGTALDQVGASWNALILTIENGEGKIKDSTQTLAKLLRIAADGGFNEALYQLTGPSGSIDDYIEKLDKQIAKEKEGAEATADHLRQQAILWRFAYDPSIDKEQIKRIGGEELLNVMLERQRASRSAITQAELQARAITQGKIDKEKELTEKIKEQLKLKREILNAQYEGLKEKDLPDNIDFSAALSPSTFSDKISKLLDEDSLNMIDEMGFKYETAFGKAVLGAEKFSESQDKLKAKSLELRGIAASLGEDFGSFFGEIAAGSLTAAQALAKSAAGMISTLKQITLARMIAANAKFGIAGIIAAAAGFGLVESLFNRISRGNRSGGGSGSGSGVTGAGATISGIGNEGLQIGGTFRIEGKDLVAAIAVENRRSNAIKG